MPKVKKSQNQATCRIFIKIFEILRTIKIRNFGVYLRFHIIYVDKAKRIYKTNLNVVSLRVWVLFAKVEWTPIC